MNPYLKPNRPTIMSLPPSSSPSSSSQNDCTRRSSITRSSTGNSTGSNTGSSIGGGGHSVTFGNSSYQNHSSPTQSNEIVPQYQTAMQLLLRICIEHERPCPGGTTTGSTFTPPVQPHQNFITTSSSNDDKEEYYSLGFLLPSKSVTNGTKENPILVQPQVLPVVPPPHSASRTGTTATSLPNRTNRNNHRGGWYQSISPGIHEISGAGGSGKTQLACSIVVQAAMMQKMNSTTTTTTKSVRNQNIQKEITICE
jgi:hypothetical protein